MHKPRVFLSYARENIAQVEELYRELVDAGIQPWLDTVDLLPGQDWELAIKSAIRQADFFSVCLSAQSVAKRGYVQREVKRALELWDEKLENDIYLIPARLDNCEVPPSLSKFQWVDGVNPTFVLPAAIVYPVDPTSLDTVRVAWSVMWCKSLSYLA